MGLTTDPQAIDARYLSDWTGVRYGTPAGLVVPRDAVELAHWLRDCTAARRPVAVQGGRTGVSGGAAPGDGEWVLALEQLDAIHDFDVHEGVIEVGAGAVLADVQALVEAQGWYLPLDLGARGSCQIGGNIATNAGGSRVVKYGTMRRSVLGVQAVLADGTLTGPPNRLVKNNAGYALAELIAGSEGTLGVITRATLRLVPLPRARRTALLALASDTALDAVLARCRAALADALSAFEVMWPDYVAGAIRAGRCQDLPTTFGGHRVVLLEADGMREGHLADLLESLLESLLETGLIVDAVLPQSMREADALWAIRESVAEIQAGIRPYVGFDLGLPSGQHDAVVERARQALSTHLPDVQAYFFGHAGDGNLHALVGPCHEAACREQVEDILYGQLTPMRDSITAEHGVGRKRIRHLHRSRSAEDIAVMRRLKAALDPAGILNPGRVLPPTTP